MKHGKHRKREHTIGNIFKKYIKTAQGLLKILALFFSYYAVNNKIRLLADNIPQSK